MCLASSAKSERAFSVWSGMSEVRRIVDRLRRAEGLKKSLAPRLSTAVFITETCAPCCNTKILFSPNRFMSPRDGSLSESPGGTICRGGAPRVSRRLVILSLKSDRSPVTRTAVISADWILRLTMRRNDWASHPSATTTTRARKRSSSTTGRTYIQPRTVPFPKSESDSLVSKSCWINSNGNKMQTSS